MTTLSKILVLCASVTAAHSGFGMFQMGETVVPGEEAGGFDSIADFHYYLLTDCGAVEIVEDEEASGKTYGQSGATIYKITMESGEIVREAHWTEEMEDDSKVLATRKEYAA